MSQLSDKTLGKEDFELIHGSIYEHILLGTLQCKDGKEDFLKYYMEGKFKGDATKAYYYGLGIIKNNVNEVRHLDKLPLIMDTVKSLQDKNVKKLITVGITNRIKEMLELGNIIQMNFDVLCKSFFGKKFQNDYLYCDNYKHTDKHNNNKSTMGDIVDILNEIENMVLQLESETKLQKAFENKLSKINQLLAKGRLVSYAKGGKRDTYHPDFIVTLEKEKTSVKPDYKDSMFFIELQAKGSSDAHYKNKIYNYSARVFNHQRYSAFVHSILITKSTKKKERGFIVFVYHKGILYHSEEMDIQYFSNYLTFFSKLTNFERGHFKLIFSKCETIQQQGTMKDLHCIGFGAHSRVFSLSDQILKFICNKKIFNKCIESFSIYSTIPHHLGSVILNKWNVHNYYIIQYKYYSQTYENKGGCIAFSKLTKFLQKVHEKGLCHCDIKPDNILFDDELKTFILNDWSSCEKLNSEINYSTMHFLPNVQIAIATPETDLEMLAKSYLYMFHFSKQQKTLLKKLSNRTEMADFWHNLIRSDNDFIKLVINARQRNYALFDVFFKCRASKPKVKSKNPQITMMDIDFSN